MLIAGVDVIIGGTTLVAGIAVLWLTVVQTVQQNITRRRNSAAAQEMEERRFATTHRFVSTGQAFARPATIPSWTRTR